MHYQHARENSPVPVLFPPSTFRLPPSQRRTRRAFSLVELLVVIGIIVILIGLLMPALSRARDLAKYTRWQAFSHNLQSDPDVCLYYNLENDRGNNTLTNMAFSSPAATTPALLNAMLSSPGASNTPAVAGSAQLALCWAQDGRFRGKPALSFISGANTLVFMPSQTSMVANLLNQTQSISIAFWIANAPNNNGAVFYWPSTASNRDIGVWVPYNGPNLYWAAGTTNGNYDGVHATVQQNTKWQFYVVTASCGTNATTAVYENGVALSAPPGSWTAAPLNGILNEAAHPLMNLNFSTNGPMIGAENGGFYWSGVLDEFCMWSRALTPAEVQQMYDAGNPGQ